MAFVPVHRYFHGAKHDHFYTTNAAEIGTTQQGATGNHGYSCEGDAFYLSTIHYPGFVPVYRYFHGGNSDHFYTTNGAEIGTIQQGATGNHGYSCEGILGYIAQTPIAGSVPVYRYFHGGSHDHFYTTNAGEIGTTQQGATGNHGYSCEGVLGYAFSSTVTGLTYPVYRYFHGGNHDHFYTHNGAEIGTTQQGATGNHGYSCEGIAFHIFAHHLQGLTPLYRYFHGGNHDHFYTHNAGEIGTTQQGASGNYGYTCEGIVGYISTVALPGTVPVYRYFHAGNNDHFYTHNAGEIGTTQEGATGNHGYKCEGILGYAFP